MYYNMGFNIDTESISKEMKEYFRNCLNKAEEKYNQKVIMRNLYLYSRRELGDFMKTLEYVVLKSAGSVLKDWLSETTMVYCLDFGDSMTFQSSHKLSGRKYEKTLFPNQSFEYKFPVRTVEDATVGGMTVGYEVYYLDHVVEFLNKYMDFILEKSVTSRIVCNDNIRMKIKDGEVCFTAKYAV